MNTYNMYVKNKLGKKNTKDSIYKYKEIYTNIEKYICIHKYIMKFKSLN